MAAADDAAAPAQANSSPLASKQQPRPQNIKAAAAAEAARIREKRQLADRRERAKRLRALEAERHAERDRLQDLNVEIRQEKEDARQRRDEAKESVALLARKARLAQEKRRKKLEQATKTREEETHSRTVELQAKRKAEAEWAARNVARQEAESDHRAKVWAERTEIEMRWTQTMDEEHISVARQRALEVAESAAKAREEWEQLLTQKRAVAVDEKKQTRADIQAQREQAQADQEESNRLAYEQLKAEEELKRIKAEEDRAKAAEERRKRREEARKAAEEARDQVAADAQWAASERLLEKDGNKQQREAVEKYHRDQRQARIFGEKIHTERLRQSTVRLHQREQAQAFELGLSKQAGAIFLPLRLPNPVVNSPHETEIATGNRSLAAAAAPQSEPSPTRAGAVQQEASGLSFGGWSHDGAATDDGIASPSADGKEQLAPPVPETSESLEPPESGSATTSEQPPAAAADREQQQSAVKLDSSQASMLSQTSVGSTMSRRLAGQMAPRNPNINPPAVTITPRQRQLAEESKSDRRKRLNANRMESSAITATQAELLRYKSNSEWKGWKAPRPPSPTTEEPDGGAAAEFTAWPVSPSETDADTIPASPRAQEAAAESAAAEAAAAESAAAEAAAAEAAAAEAAAAEAEQAPNPDQDKSSVDTTKADKSADETAAVATPAPAPASASSSLVSRMECLEQGIEYRPLKPPALRLPSAAPDEPPVPSPASHLGAGLFTTDAEPGPSNALAPELSEEQLQQQQQPVGPRSITAQNPRRSVAAAIASERSAVLNERKTTGLAPGPRRTLRPVVTRGSTPRTSARQALTGTPSAPNSDAMRAARVVLAEEWRNKAFVPAPQVHLDALPPLKQRSGLGSSGPQPQSPNSSGWHGGCGDWLKSTGNTLRAPAFDTAGRQSPVADGPVPSHHLPVVADLWPRPPPKPRVQATKVRRLHATTPRAGSGRYRDKSRSVASVAQTERGIGYAPEPIMGSAISIPAASNRVAAAVSAR